MKPAETLTLCRYVKAVCPQQQIDDYTPDAWHDLLGQLRFEDCREAARNLGQDQHFIDPADIRKEVKRIRRRRLDDHPTIDPPGDLDEIEYRRWLQGTRQAIADGQTLEPIQLPTRAMPALPSKEIP